MGGRIRYTEEFKLGAVAQVTDKGHRVTSVAGRLTLFDTPDTRSPKLMTALDAVNNRYGKKSLVIAREGFTGRTAMRQQYQSPRYMIVTS